MRKIDRRGDCSSAEAGWLSARRAPLLVAPQPAAQRLGAPGDRRHRPDPFDRMIIAQARVEGMAVLSYDRAFDSYEVRRVC